MEETNRQRLAPGRVVDENPRLEPLAPQRFAVQFTIGQSAHERLRRAQELLSRRLPSGDLAEIFVRPVA